MGGKYFKQADQRVNAVRGNVAAANRLLACSDMVEQTNSQSDLSIVELDCMLLHSNAEAHLLSAGCLQG